jgi:hypothetical protein
MREQGEVVPRTLQGSEALAVVDDRRHPSQKLFVMVRHERGTAAKISRVDE